jgi:hypothetical protein
MSRSGAGVIPIADGDVIRRPVHQAWMFIVFGLAALSFGLAWLGVFWWFAIQRSPPTGIAVLFHVLGFIMVLVGVVVLTYGIRQRSQCPRWVFGVDRLQYVVGQGEKAEVWWDVPYENLEAVELCKPSLGLEPFIGLRLFEPQAFPVRVAPFISQTLLERFGFDYRIAKVECDMPLTRVLELLQERMAAWKESRR